MAAARYSGPSATAVIATDQLLQVGVRRRRSGSPVVRVAAVEVVSNVTPVLEDNNR
jgi:hypothetical protein